MVDYEKALEFWNKTYEGADNYEVDDVDIAGFGCPMLENELKALGKCKRVLDFGCGGGWASHYIARFGTAEVLGTDTSENAVKAAVKVAKKFDIKNVAYEVSAVNALDDYAGDLFDGVFSCNVLDVVPKEIGLRIIKQLASVSASGAKTVIMLNPYADKELLEKLNMQELEASHYARDGILRMYNLTDAEWITAFSPYYDCLGVEKFHFEGEPDYYNRRLFKLIKR